MCISLAELNHIADVTAWFGFVMRTLPCSVHGLPARGGALLNYCFGYGLGICLDHKICSNIIQNLSRGYPGFIYRV